MIGKRGSAGGLAIAGVSLVLTSGAAVAAINYRATTTSDQGTMSLEAWIDDANARINFLEGEGGEGFFAGGNYLVTTDGGTTVRLVNPTDETYMLMDLGALLGFAGAILDMTQGLVDMEFTDVVNETLGEEPAEDILGYATTHHRYRTSYTMTVRVLGFARATTIETHTDLWCTDEVEVPNFGLWMRPNQATGNEDLDTLIGQAFQGLDCMPLRTQATTTTTGQRGRPSTTTSMTEVTALQEDVTADPMMFIVPEHYAETSMIPELPADVETSADTDADGSDAEAEADGERPRIRLRDLLRR